MLRACLMAIGDESDSDDDLPPLPKHDRRGDGNSQHENNFSQPSNPPVGDNTSFSFTELMDIGKFSDESQTDLATEPDTKADDEPETTAAAPGFNPRKREAATTGSREAGEAGNPGEHGRCIAASTSNDF